MKKDRSGKAITLGKHGTTPLMRAAAVKKENPVELVALLNESKHRRTIFDRDESGKTALDWARISTNYIGVRLLLDAMNTEIHNSRIESIASPEQLHRILISTNSHQGSQLLAAVQERKHDVAEDILRNNRLARQEIEALGQQFFTDAKNRVGYTPLMLAAGMNMKDVVRELVLLKAPINEQNQFGQTALTIACSTGNADVVQFLLASGADVQHRTEEGRTVLHYACMYAKAKLVKIILSFLIERFAVFRIEGHKLVEFDYTRWTTYSSIITGFIKARDNDGKTALDLLPKKLDDKYRIEKRLRLSGITGLERLSRKGEGDKWSVGSDSARLQNTDDAQSQYDEFDEDIQPFSNLKSRAVAASSHRTGEQLSSNSASYRFQIPNRKQYGNEEDVVDPDVDTVASEVTESSQFSFFDFSHNTDNDIVPSVIEDAYSAHTAMPLEKELEYIRNCFDKVEQKVFQWQSNAEKEKELAQIMPCPLECGAMCRVEDMTTHVRDECPLRTLQCPTCHLIILQKDVTVHTTRLCGKRTIACPNAYAGCAILITPDSKALHLQIKCEFRQVPCRQFCSATVAWKDLDRHEAEFCNNRSICCDQCHQKMVAHEYPGHLLEACSERMITCRIGCGQQFKAKDLDAHENQVCQGYCKWDCGVRIGPPAKLQLHEAMHCSNRPVTCCLNCGIPKLTLRNKSHHEQFQCQERIVSCTYGCGEELPIKHMRRHQQMFTGTCSRRLVYCPSNLVGWRIKLIKWNTDALILKYERKKLPSFLTGGAIRQSAAGVIAESEQTMSYRTETVFGDFLYVRSPKGQKWVNIWTTDFILLEKAIGEQLDKSLHRECHFSCGKFLFVELTNHLYINCPNRKVAVTGEVDRSKNSVGQVVALADAVEMTQLRLEYDDFEEREKVNEDGSQGVYNVTCSYCANTVVRSEYEQHCIKECSEYHIFCPFGCGKYMANRDVDCHCRNDCPKRSVTCPKCFFSDLWSEELSNHQREKCPKRIVACVFQCGIDALCACDKTKHEEEECGLRNVMCSCGLFFQAKDLSDHEKLNCVNRQVFCPQGCGESMKQCEVDNHIEFFCRNKTHYFNQTIECGNGCGNVLMRRDLLHHISFECTKRLVECSQHCGNTVVLDNLKSHLRVCPQRILSCEPGMSMCAKPFHEWFYKMPAEEDENTYHNIALEHLNKNNKSKTTVNQLQLIQQSIMDENEVASEADNMQEDDSIGGLSDQSSFNEERFKKIRKINFQVAKNKLRNAFRNKLEGKNTTENNGALETIDEEANTDGEDVNNDAINAEDDDEAEDEKSTDFDRTFKEKKEKLFQGNSVNISINLGVSKLPGIPASLMGETTESPQTKSIFDMLVVSRNKNQKKGGSHSGSGIGGHSSIYYDGPAMKFREDMRMHFCHRHRVHALMAAVRYQEYDVLEFIARQVKQSSDIDLENHHGDTALTLACRMGCLPYVQILITHGADINKETFNGRTALIEAVKCEIENVPLIEFLIREGALIKYKTARHGKTSLDWARRYAYQEAQELKEKATLTGEQIEITKERMRVLGRPHTVRLLELAAVVQQQSNLMFQKIAIGDNKWVLRVIQEGDFFDPNNEKKAYAEMEKFALKAEEADRRLADVQAKTFGLSSSIDQLGAKRDQVREEIKKGEKVVSLAYDKERALDSTISSEFSSYEKIAAQMKLIDLEEVVRLQNPSDILLTTLFTTGYLFELYDEQVQYQLDNLLLAKHSSQQRLQSGMLLSEQSMSSQDVTPPTLSIPFIVESRSIWFPVILRFLRTNMKEALRRLQTFSRGKIHLDRSQALFAKVMDIVQVFRMLAYQSSAQAATSSNLAAKAAAEAAAAKASRAERRRQRQLQKKEPPVSPSAFSPSANERKRITFTPDVSHVMPIEAVSADEGKLQLEAPMQIQDPFEMVSEPALSIPFSSWQESNAFSSPQSREMSKTASSESDNFWAGIDADILEVPYIDAVQVEEEEKDRKRHEAYKAWLDYQLVSSGKKSTIAYSMNSTRDSSAFASTAGSVPSFANSLRGRPPSPTRITTTIVDGKPVVFRPDSTGDFLGGQENATDNEDPENAVMNDDDWDSDAETGKWEKGEWVPIVRVKKTWWNPAALSEQLKAEKVEKVKQKEKEEKETWKKAKIIRITDNWLEEETKRTVSELKCQQKLPEDYEQMLLESIRQKQLAAAAEAEAEAEAKQAGNRGRSLRSSVSMKVSSAREKSRSKSRSKSITGMNISGLDALPDTPFVVGETPNAGQSEEGEDDNDIADGRMNSPPPSDSSPNSALRDRHQSRRRSMLKKSPMNLFAIPTESGGENGDGNGLDQDSDVVSFSSSAASSRGGSPSRTSSSRRRKQRRKHHHRHKSTMLGDDVLDYDLLSSISQDDFVGYQLVAAIDRLLRAITRFALNYKDVLIYKQGTLQAIRSVEALKQEAVDLSEKYAERFEFRAQVEKEYIQAMKNAKFLQDKVTAYKEKVRVARLMNAVSVNGHTPISWAAAYGAFDVVEEMLSRGGMIGFNAQLYHMTATYLQMSYQIYLVSFRARNKQAQAAQTRREQAQGLLPKDLPLVAGAKGNSKAQQMELMKELTLLKDKRSKLLDHIKYLRSKMRFPIPEAVYTGHWEIVKRVYERRLLQPYFLNTWTYPSPPPTYRRRLERQYDNRKYSILEVLTHGMNDLAAGAYIPGNGGWVGANDSREPYGETYMEVHRIIQLLKERKHDFQQGRHRIRILSNERRNQREGEKAMIAAILRHDFIACMQLAQDRGITIDLETADGQTALIAASEEDPDAMNHQYMVNVDGRKCLAVEYLLDRVYYRPGINLETTQGYTALIRAAMLGRAHVVSALLDRGANINYQNTKHGRTALHYAAACGHEDVTRILVERLADVSIQDFKKQTAYDIAEGENFIHLMSVLSQFRSGNLGAVQLTRGNVNNQTVCPLGCGCVLFPYEIPAHVELCSLRNVSCPLGCNLRTLAREVETHQLNECPKRLVFCGECAQEEQIVAEKMPEHLREDCIKRIVPCPLTCGKEMQFCDVDLHVLRHCGQRLVHCPNQCPADMQLCFVALPEHLEAQCINRRVPCPNKCHSMVIWHRLEEHMRDVCSLRIIHCQFCSSPIPFDTKERHETQECAQRPVQCPWKCGQFVRAEDLEVHRMESCGKQAVDCPLKCGRKVYRQVLANHLERECPQRLVPCPNHCIERVAASELAPEGVQSATTVLSVLDETQFTANNHERVRSLPAKLLPYHLKYDCPHRPLRCSICQEMTTFHLLSQHQAQECVMRIVHCRNPGCQKTLPFDQREEHEIRLCRFRMSLCPQACGEHVLTLHLTNHCTRQCLMRYVDACPLQCTLLAPLRAKDVEQHLLLECPRRHNNSSNPSNAVMNDVSRPGSTSNSIRSISSVSSKKGKDNIPGGKVSIAASASMHQLLAATAPPPLSRQQQQQHSLGSVLMSVPRPSSQQQQQQSSMLLSQSTSQLPANTTTNPTFISKRLSK